MLKLTQIIPKHSLLEQVEKEIDQRGSGCPGSPDNECQTGCVGVTLYNSLQTQTR